MNMIIQIGIDQVLAEPNAGGAKTDERDQLRSSAVIFKMFQFLFVQASLERSKFWGPEIVALAETVPRRRAGRNVDDVRRLFSTSHVAAANVLVHDVIRKIAAAQDVSDQQALKAMVSEDISLAIYLPTLDVMQELHTYALENPKDACASFDAAAGAHACASNLAVVSGLINRWTVLGFNPTEEGGVRYERTDLLNHLLSGARESALVNIAECKSRDIPCICPIYYFESAEMSRDDPEEDKVDVLTDYWNASLQAKVLLMSFPPED